MNYTLGRRLTDCLMRTQVCSRDEGEDKHTFIAKALRALMASSPAAADRVRAELSGLTVPAWLRTALRAARGR
jgi:hypothetical protein